MKKYTAKEMKVLKANPYIFKVTKNKLYFTIKFKEAFWTAYQAGMTPRKIYERRDVSGCKKYHDIKVIIDDWIDYYNKSRYQWQLAKLSPDEYYEYVVTGVYPLEGIVSDK